MRTVAVKINNDQKKSEKLEFQKSETSFSIRSNAPFEELFKIKFHRNEDNSIEKDLRLKESYPKYLEFPTGLENGDRKEYGDARFFVIWTNANPIKQPIELMVDFV